MILDVFSILALITTLGIGVYLGYRYGLESRRMDAMVAHALDDLSARPREWDDEEWWAAR